MGSDEQTQGTKHFLVLFFPLGVVEDDRWRLWVKSSWHLPLALVQGLESCSISQYDDVSRDDIITFRAFPGAGAHVASPPEDWSRMFWAQEGWVEWPSSRCEGLEGGSLGKPIPTPSLPNDGPWPQQLRSPDTYDPLIPPHEKPGPEAHCFSLSKWWLGKWQRETWIFWRFLSPFHALIDILYF